MNGRRCLCLLGKLWRARSQLAAHEVLAVRREAARNRMVPVGGVRCSHHNEAREDRSGLPRGHARLTYRRGAAARNTSSGGSTEAKIWGRRPGVGPLQASKIGPGGTAGATSTEWWLFCSSV